tara:strand:- start:2481 stop:3812 length:1332 start_codon:yes stop_codon:yes gene_type:complete
MNTVEIKNTIATMTKGRVFVSTTDYLRSAIVPAMVHLGSLPSDAASQIRGQGRIDALRTVERIQGFEAREACESLICEYKASKVPASNTIASDITAQISGIIQNAMASSSPSVSSSQIQDEIDDKIIPVLDRIHNLEKEYQEFKDSFKANPSKVARANIQQASSDNLILKRVLPFYPDQGSCLKTLVTSPPSYGKSYSIRKLGKAYDLYLEHGCSDSIDEETTLIGKTIPDGNGGFAVVDGVLTEAVRSASKGNRVLLFLDEVLRWPIVSQEFLLSFLEPHKGSSGDSEYVLRTLKMQNGNSELIRCNVKNLHIVAAGNRSANSITEAFWSRWHKVNIKFDVTEFAGICNQIADTYDVVIDAGEFATAASVSRDRFNDMRTKAPIDCRTLVNAIEWSGSDDWDVIKSWIRDTMEDQLVESDARTGDPLEDSLDAIREIKNNLQ